MKVVIIEDEAPAADKLTRYLNRYESPIEVLAVLSSVSASIGWFKQNLDQVELIFMDIQLTDGLSFSIFKEVDINKPIIFTTAYDEYALKAFEVNSIAYLLKPITFPDLSAAIEKHKSLQKSSAENSMHHFKELLQDINNTKAYKTRFMVKIGGHIRSILAAQIVYFFAEGRNAYISTNEGRNLIIDYKLEELEELLNPEKFFRVNRTYIVNIDSITEVLVHSNSRLKIITELPSDKDIIVSRDKVGVFKQWFDGQ